ncbi:kinase-like domain-containing protein [Sporodiniella umbellata]|nr:kinase-like domain-containing protein [Sporodiniella umbellata]
MHLDSNQNFQTTHAKSNFFFFCDHRDLPPTSWSLNDFEIGPCLGKGKFGQVYLAREKKSELIIALKIILKSEIILSKTQKQTEREIAIQLGLGYWILKHYTLYSVYLYNSHPNILRLFGFFHDESNLFFILEYAAQGELFHKIQQRGRFDEPLVAKYATQLTKALIYLHSRHIIHRDIKPENLLLDSKGNIKMSDFGWSVKTRTINNRRLTLCGTLDYLPPEMVEGREHDEGIDIWSLGVLLYEMLVGNPPFEVSSKLSETEMHEKTYQRISAVDLKIPEFISNEAEDLIRKLLKHKSEERLPLRKVLYHPFLKKWKK